MSRKLKKIQAELEQLKLKHEKLKSEFDVFVFLTKNPTSYSFSYVERNDNSYFNLHHLNLHRKITDIYFEYVYKEPFTNNNFIYRVWLGDICTDNLNEIKYEVISENKYSFILKYSYKDYTGKECETYYEIEKKTRYHVNISNQEIPV